MINILLVNDTSIENHFGSEIVIENIKKILKKKKIFTGILS